MENNKEKAEDLYQQAEWCYQNGYIYDALDLVNTALYHCPDFTEAIELKENLKGNISNMNTPIVYRKKPPTYRKITKEETRKSLLYSIFVIGTTLFIISLCYNPDIPLHFSTRFFAIITSSTFMLLGLVSIIVYLINPEIAYGMWIGTRRRREIKNQNITTGRWIQVVIILIGLAINLIVFFSIISIILP